MSPRGRSATEGKRTAILDAALRLFGRYGYRRTSIDDIANEAEIAKGTVYLSFKSKEEIFRALCESLIARVQDNAERARLLDEPLQARVLAILEAKFGLYFEVVRSSAHAAELMDSKNRLSDDLFEKHERRYQRLLREVIEAAAVRGEIRPESLGLDPGAVTELLLSGAKGIESSVSSAAVFHRRLAELVRVIFAGITGTSQVSIAR